MGAHTCQHGTVHKTCRCIKEHRIPCPTPDKCKSNKEDSKEDLHYDEDTLFKVREALHMLDDQQFTDAISEMQNAGILFRERGK